MQVDIYSSGVLMNLPKDCGLPASGMRDTDVAE